MSYPPWVSISVTSGSHHSFYPDTQVAFLWVHILSMCGYIQVCFAWFVLCIHVHAHGMCGVLLIFLLTLPLSNIITKLKDDQCWLEVFLKCRPISWLAGQDVCCILLCTYNVADLDNDSSNYFAFSVICNSIVFFFSNLDGIDVLSTTLLLSYKPWLAPSIGKPINLNL